jgi:hypothetical protein
MRQHFQCAVFKQRRGNHLMRRESDKAFCAAAAWKKNLLLILSYTLHQGEEFVISSALLLQLGLQSVRRLGAAF